MLRWLFILTGLLMIGGCAHQSTSDSTALPPPTTAPSLDSKATLSLDAVPNRPVLGSTQHSNYIVPVDALVWYANGIDQLEQRHPVQAVAALKKALASDSNSHAAYLALGEALLYQFQAANEQSIDAFEHAAILRPDALDIHLLLARQYVDLHNHPKAIEHLRLALQTSQYSTDDVDAANAEYLLGTLLNQDGYSAGALELFTRLERRLTNPSEDLRVDPDIGLLILSPQWLWEQIGTLSEKLGRYQDAMKAYQLLADDDPANFDLQANLVRINLRLGQNDQAAHLAADLVQRFSARKDSLELLQGLYMAQGPDRCAEALRHLSKQLPDNHGILVALADLWASNGRADEARQLLKNATDAHPGDALLVRKLCDLYMDQGDSAAAAKLLIEQLAARPEAEWRIQPIFDDLTGPMRKDAIRPTALQKFEVAPSAEAAKLYLLSRAAERWNRQVLSRDSLESAVKLSPPFAPAYRAAQDAAVTRADATPEERVAACQQLANSADSAGDHLLAEELRARFLSFQRNFAAATAMLQDVAGGEGASPQVQLVYAAALEGQGKADQFRQALRQLLAQEPQFDDAWSALYDSYADAGLETESQKVLLDWLRADPLAPDARLHQVRWDMTHDRDQLADQRLQRLLEDRADDPQVLAAVQQYYSQLHRPEMFLGTLEELHHRAPTDLTVVGALANGYRRAGRQADAERVLDQARGKIGDNTELLYQLAALYHDIRLDRVYEQLLGEILKVDATNVPASNDLGYAWADAGTNLDRAEELIRHAVAAEPDNEMFLDSLGWVMYKRGKFTEAADLFQQAIGLASAPDPEILDHFGDDLYRLGKSAEAIQKWQQSFDELQSRRMEEDVELRLHIQRKLEQSRLGQPVTVAPVARPEQ